MTSEAPLACTGRNPLRLASESGGLLVVKQPFGEKGRVTQTEGDLNDGKGPGAAGSPDGTGVGAGPIRNKLEANWKELFGDPKSASSQNQEGECMNG